MANESKDWKGAIRVKDASHTTNQSARYKGAVQLVAVAAPGGAIAPLAFHHRQQMMMH